jgi:arabinofuranan 3-O-arabinosyltransferase
VAERLLLPADVPAVSASSRYTPEIAQRPQAVFDDDPATTWLAATADTSPRLSLSWDQERRISSLRWFVASGVFVSRPATLSVTVGGTTRTVPVDQDGWARFEPLTGKNLVVTVTSTVALPTRDPVLGLTTTQPIGLTELIVPALDDLRRGLPDNAPVSLPCGRGPGLLVGDTEVPTRVSGTAGQLLRREPMAVVPCPAEVRLPAGLTRIRLDDNRLVVPQTLLLRRTAAAAPAAPQLTRPTRIESLSTEHRRITVAAAAEPQLLVVHENANPGWRATLDGRPLSSVRVDGWQQAWLVPAAGGEVDLLFVPGRSYRIGLVLGLLILVGLALVAIGAAPGRSRAGHRRAPAQLLEAAPAGPRYTLVGMCALLAIGGAWAVGPLLGSLLLARLRRAWLTTAGVVACGIAAVAAALSAGAEDVGLLAVVGSLCGLVVLSLQLVRLDLDGDHRSLLHALALSARWAGTRRGPEEGASTSPRAAPEAEGTSFGSWPDDAFGADPDPDPEPDWLRVR